MRKLTEVLEKRVSNPAILGDNQKVIVATSGRLASSIAAVLAKERGRKCRAFTYTSDTATIIFLH
jgi:hypothetical protein